MRDGDEWLYLADLRFRNPDDTMRAIAAHLRNGQLDQRFLDALANCIDPDSRTLFGTKLVVGRGEGAGAPPAQIDFELEAYLETHIDFFGEKQESVFAAAKARFGVGRTRCTDALRELRARRHEAEKRFPGFTKMHEETAFALRDAGDPDYQPI